MDFETLSRRDLQALCKKNKIPANITNVAMINALKALTSVEGIDELVQQSPGQNNAAKQEPETVQPLTRTRRTARKTLAKDAVEDTTETPSVVQTTTRRARVNSVCRKMDSQLRDCEEEDKKKGALATPVPSGVASRRIRGVKEESVVKREYSTRRSVRLAEKVEVLDEVENEKSAMFKSELFTKDGENVSANFEECLENTSGITGIDAEENPKGIDESEVVSAQKHHMQIGEENDLAANLEGNDESESIPVQVQHIHTVKETEKAATTFEEEKNQMSEADDLKVDVEQVLSKAMDVDVNSSVEENLEGSVKEMWEDQDMGFDVNEEQGTDEICQGVTDDSKIDPPSETSLMNEADESAMPESFEGSDSHLNVTPFKEVYARNKENRITIISDNKENIKVVLRKETVKNAADSAKELSDLSVRKLTKMLREKLQINEARGRPALQTLPENRMVDETHN